MKPKQVISWFVALASLAHASVLLGETNVDMTFRVDRSGLYSALLTIDSRQSEAHLVGVFVPFDLKLSSTNRVAAVIKGRDGDVLLVAIPADVSIVTVEVEPRDGAITASSAITIKQIARGTLLEFQHSATNLPAGFDDFEDAGVVVASRFRNLSVDFPDGVTIIKDLEEYKAVGRRIEPLQKSEHQKTSRLLYVLPKESWEETAETLLSRLFLVLVAVLFTFAAPDFIPQNWQVRALIVLSGLIVVAVFVKWVLAFRDRNQFEGAMADTLAASIYFIAVGFIYWARKKKGDGST